MSAAVNQVDAGAAVLAVDVDNEVCKWASDRGQVLSRTVRGVMLYGDALRVLARLEGVPEEELEALVSSKFEFVVTCQIYGKLKSSSKKDDLYKAQCIDDLRHRFAANLKIAYVETVGKDNWSVLLGVDPKTHQEQVLYKVKLPGNPIIGEGKPENQNHAIIFTRGEYLQTLDMNQDNYMGESFKMRNMLECFKGEVRLVGCREHIFSEAGGAVAEFAASNEFVFGTSLQRFLTFPLSVRFHYGHPDVWDKQWTMSNGGVSKASKTLHLSEDIFGGMNVIFRGGAVSYQEFIHVGKGRDMGFIAINGFEQKISAGNALQCSSRELYRMGKFFDIFRLMSFYFTGAGFFLTNRITTGIIYLLCVTRVVMALLDSEELQMTFFEDAPPSGRQLTDLLAGGLTGGVARRLTELGEYNSSIGLDGQLPAALAALEASWGTGANGTAGGEVVGTWTVNTYESAFGIVQLGFFAIVPLFLELWLERDFVTAVWENVKLVCSGSWIFFLFTAQTKGYHFARAIGVGKAGYVATGRGFVIEPSSFVRLFALYAKSHIYTGVETLIYLVLYECYKTKKNTLSVTWASWMFAVAMMGAPWLFNPQCFSFTNIKASAEEIQHWLVGKADPDSSEHKGDWVKWHAFRLAEARDKPLEAKVRDNVRLALLRCVLLVAASSSLRVEGDKETNHCSRVGTMLLCGLGMSAALLVFYGANVLLRVLRAQKLHCGDGSRWLIAFNAGSPFQVAALGGCVVAYGYFVEWYAVQTSCLSADNHNWGLLVFGGLLLNTYALQLFVTLADVPSRRALAQKDKAGKYRAGPLTRGLAWAKLRVIAMADFFYFINDALICWLLLTSLFLLSLLPLLTLQSSVLFRSQNFARVIAKKLRHADLLERILS